MIKTPDKTERLEALLEQQTLRKNRDGLDPGLLKKSESVIDAIYMKDSDVDIDVLEKQYQILSDYFFISARKKGYVKRQDAFQAMPHFSIMVLPLEAKLKRQIELLKLENAQLRRKIDGTKKAK